MVTTTAHVHKSRVIFHIFQDLSNKKLRQDPLEAILVIFGGRALIFFV